MRFSSWLVAAAAFGLAVAPFGAAFAQDYPDRPVHIIVGYAPGGSTDTAGRIVGQQLSELLGQPFVVENRPGANAMIAHQLAATAAADGYTLIIDSTADTVNVLTKEDMPYEFPGAFEPIARLTQSSFLVVVGPNSPVQSVEELFEYAKTNSVTFGSSGVGTPSHLGAVLMLLSQDIEGTHVPYEGAGPLAQAVLGGQVDFGFANMSSSLGLVESGDLRAIAQSGAERSFLVPAVPTVAESGVPGFNVISWAGISAPKGTPPEIVAMLSEAALTALADPDVKETFAKAGTETYAAPSDEYAEFLNDQIEQWRSVVEAAGLAPTQ